MAAGLYEHVFLCSVVVVGSVSSGRDLSSDVMTAFIHQVTIDSLTEDQRRMMLTSLSEELPLGKDVSLARIAKQTAVRHMIPHIFTYC